MLQSIPILRRGTGLIKEHLAPWFSSWSYMMELMFWTPSNSIEQPQLPRD